MIAMMDKQRGDIADRDTPLFRNEWYVAAGAQEVTRKPMRRVILNQDIVLYRKEDGSAVALQNRCAHRSFPLSEGTLNGDRIVCGYHGFEYDPDGRCALVPALGKAVSSIRVESYALVEQGPLVWIWMGDGEPDHSRFVVQPWFTDAGWTSVSGYFHMKANYLGLHENLLDLTHFPFLHGALLGKPQHAAAQLKIRSEDGTLHCSVVHEDAPVPHSIVAAEHLTAPFERRVDMEVTSPAVHVGKTLTLDSSEPRKSFYRMMVHCMTPETQTSTHYFWAIARDAALNDQEVDEALRAIGRQAFDEDRVALEQIEQLIAQDHRPGFREKIVSSDSAGVQLLRAFAKRARENA